MQRFANFTAQRVAQRVVTTSSTTTRRFITTQSSKTTPSFTFHSVANRGTAGLKRDIAPEPSFHMITQLPQQKHQFQRSIKQFSSEAASDAPQAVIENLVAAQAGFVSRALRTKASAKYKNLPISPHKLRYLCKLIKGMNVREAIIQLRLCSKRKSYFLRRGIRTLTNSAINTFNMTKDRLIVSELSVNRGVQYARVDFRARGRANLKMKFRTHLKMTLAEQPYHAGEIRIGRYGRTIDTWKKFDKLSEAWKLKRAEENGI